MFYGVRLVSAIAVWIDGASRGNPGEAGAGVFVRDDEGNNLAKISKYLGDSLTNNQAEYSALLKALEYGKSLDVDEVKVFSDSDLLVKQMSGEYRVDSENLKDLYEEAKGLESEFGKVVYKHISREKNSIADNLANEAIDEEEP